MDRPTDCVVTALNLTPFDLKGNRAIVETILDEVKSRFGSNRRPFVLFPERTLTGPCGDFSGTKRLRDAAYAELESILPKTEGLCALFGLPGEGGTNETVLVADGAILPVRPDAGPFLLGPLKATLAKNSDCSDAELIFDPAPRRFTFGSDKKFEAAAARRTLGGETLFASAEYLGNIAGTEIFSGGAFIARGGKVVARTERFDYHEGSWTSVPLDVPSSESAESPSPAWEISDESTFEEFARAVPLGLFDYLRKSRAGGLTLSLSGGADSASIAVMIRLMALFGVRSLGTRAFLSKLPRVPGVKKLLAAGSASDSAAEPTEKEIVAALLTTVYQATAHSGEVTRRAAEEIARSVGSVHYHFNIDPIVEAYKTMISDALGRPLSWTGDDLALQNIQARTRGPSVWLLANLTGALLLSTGNRSEVAVGYATMDGDTCGCLSPIAGVSKAFLRKWLRWMETVGTTVEPDSNGEAARFRVPALSFVNAQQPTAELRPPQSGQTDESDLMPYSLLEIIERGAVFQKLTGSPLRDYVRGEARKITELADFSDERLEGQIEKFGRLFARSEWKRHRGAPAFRLDDVHFSSDDPNALPLLTGDFSL